MKGTSWWSSDLDSCASNSDWTPSQGAKFPHATRHSQTKSDKEKKGEEKKKNKNKKINYMDNHSIQIFRNPLQMQSPNKSKMSRKE